MNKRIIVLAFTLVVSMMVLQTGSAFAAEGMADGDITARNGADVVLDVVPDLIFEDVKHVANGVAMRNYKTGRIHLRGIPAGSIIVRAHLFWNFSNGLAVGKPRSQVKFGLDCKRQMRVRGFRCASSADPCWGLVGNHTYWADVTKLVKGNGDYGFETLEPGVTVTGVNPWPLVPAPTIMEGATLVVVYKGPTTGGSSVFIYWHGLGGSMFSGTGTFNLFHPPTPPGIGLFTMSGADGQRGFGHDNGISGETTTFNGVLIAGGAAPAAAPSSDWDGSAGWPLNQLWDVHTHRVDNINPGGPVADVVVYTSFGDCLVPAVFVLQVGAFED